MCGPAATRGRRPALAGNQITVRSQPFVARLLLLSAALFLLFAAVAGVLLLLLVLPRRLRACLPAPGGHDA